MAGESKQTVEIEVKELIEKTLKVRKKCDERARALEKRLGLPVDAADVRTACLVHDFNRATLCFELLNFYHSQWTRPTTGYDKEVVERAKRENGERCMEVLKFLFILSMSSIEYCARETLGFYAEREAAKELAKRKGRFLYLSDIVRNSKDKGVIDAKAKERWDGLISVRNCIVHNNGVSDREEAFVLKGHEVIMHEGQMMKGKLHFYIDITDLAMDEYYSWLNEVITACQ